MIDRGCWFFIALAALSLSPASVARAGEDTQVFAIAIGWNGGNKGLPTLKYADDDAVRVAAVMTHLSRQQPGAVQLLTEFDETTRAQFRHSGTRLPQTQRPTRGAVVAAVDALSGLLVRTKRRGHKRQVFLHYAGHGLTDQVLLAPENEAEATLSGRELWLLATRLAASDPEVSVFLFVDACRAQSLFALRGDDDALPAGPDLGEQIRDLERQSASANIGLLTASTTVKPAGEISRLASGLFSHVLLSGLLGAADANQDGKVSFGELSAFVALYTQQITGQMPWFEAPPGGWETLVTNLEAHRPQMFLGQDIAGHVEVRAQSGLPWVAQTNKAQASRLQFTLPAGTYRIVNRHDLQKRRSVDVELRPGQVLSLAAAGWTSDPVLRGPGDEFPHEPAFDTPFTNEVVATLQAGYLAGRAQPANRERIRRDSHLDLWAGAVQAPLGLGGAETRLGLGYRLAVGMWYLGAQLRGGRSEHSPGEAGYRLYRLLTLAEGGRCLPIYRNGVVRAFVQLGNAALIRSADKQTGDLLAPTVVAGLAVSWRIIDHWGVQASGGVLSSWFDVDGRSQRTSTAFAEAGLAFNF